MYIRMKEEGSRHKFEDKKFLKGKSTQQDSNLHAALICLADQNHPYNPSGRSDGEMDSSRDFDLPGELGLQVRV